MTNTPTNLILESYEIDGARKLLLKLQQDYSMSLVPSVKCHCKGNFGALPAKERFDWFPIKPKYRKVVGDGMIRFLLTDKDNIRRYVYEDCDLDMKFEHDKKGNPIRCEISIAK